MTGRPRSLAAFTLVEILIVVLLMGILAGVVITAAAPTFRDQLVAAAQIVAADLSYGRSLAVLNNDNYQFTFSLANNQYTLQYSGSNSSLATLPPSPFQSSQDPATQFVVRLGQLPGVGVAVEIYDVQELTPQPVEAATVQFGPTGATTQAQPTVVWLTAGTGLAQRYISISIDPATGLATVGSFQGAAPAVGSATAGTGGTSGVTAGSGPTGS
jgi:Tfp pilus assembly protein FimT